MQDAPETHKKELLYYFSSVDFDNKVKFNAITRIYEQLDIKSKTETLFEEFAQKSLEELDNIQIDDNDKKQVFKDIAIELSYRKKMNPAIW